MVYMGHHPGRCPKGQISQSQPRQALPKQKSASSFPSYCHRLIPASRDAQIYLVSTSFTKAILGSKICNFVKICRSYLKLSRQLYPVYLQKSKEKINSVQCFLCSVINFIKIYLHEQQYTIFPGINEPNKLITVAKQSISNICEHRWITVCH
jgi:hypothetical protein